MVKEENGEYQSHKVNNFLLGLKVCVSLICSVGISYLFCPGGILCPG